MATREGKNPNTPSAGRLTNISLDDFLQQINTDFEKKNVTEKDNQKQRENEAKSLELAKKLTEERRKQNEYARADLARKTEILKEEAEVLNNQKELLNILKQKTLAGRDYEKLTDSEKEYYKYILEREDDVTSKLSYRETLLKNQQKYYEDFLNKHSTLLQRTDRLKQKLSSAKKEFDSLKETRSEEYAKHELRLKDFELQFKNKEISEEEYQKRVNAENAGFSEVMKDLEGNLKHLGKLGIISSTLNTISRTLSTIGKAVDGGIQQAADDRRQYQGRVDARLQGLDGVDFEHFTSTALQWSSSSLINQSKYLASVNKLTDSGIAYNLENRALIETIGEKLVTTFETTNSTLLRLTRIQQSDLTVSQLGAEARLTQFLNSMFKDTSYLTDAYDSVRDTLLDAASLMSVEDSTSFMYNVQKWLGSLYSMGVSSQGVQNIAQGLAYLGSGNASALSSNVPLQTLIVQSLNKAGYNYADVLHRGLDSTTTDNLLKAMVENLQSIANNTSSNVLKSAWSSVIGVGTTDLRAITHLQNSDLVSILNEQMNYTSSVNEAYNQMQQLGDRTYISEQIDNYLNNLVYGIGSAVAGNRESYLTLRGIQLAKDVTSSMFGDMGGGVFGNLVNGIQGFAEAATILSALANSGYGNADTSSWGAIGAFFKDAFKGGADLITGSQALQMLNWEQYTSRGDLISSYVDSSVAQPNTSWSGTTSQIGNTYSLTQPGTTATSQISNASDITSLASNAEAISASYETISDATATVVRDASDIYHELFEAQTTPIKVKLSDIEEEAAKKLLVSGRENYPVDIIDSDIDAVGQVLKSLPLVRTDDW